MSKKDEALKLALEAQIHKAGMNPIMQGECFVMHPQALQKIIEVSIREALAEQPAQVDPCIDGSCSCCWTHLDEQPAQQREPVAWADAIIDDLHALHDSEMIRELDSGSALIRLNDAVAAVEEAAQRYTSPQPAQQQEPVAYVRDEENVSYMFTTPMRLEQTDQEPVAKVCHDLDGHIGWNPKLTQLPDEGTLLYTSPPASKPWAGLTDEEIAPINEVYEFFDGFTGYARAIEAKLREKNA